MEALIDESETKAKKPGTSRRFFRAAGLASVGLEMGVAVVLGWWFGQYLDRKLGTEPWLMVVFLLFGVAAAFKAIIRTTKQIQRESEAESDEQASNE